MCGIGGIVRVTPPGQRHVPIPEAWADALDAAIAWRGADGAGRFRDLVIRPNGTTVEVVLVHRRLSIIDHQGGAQPMVSERGPRGEGLVAVVFNGCIYNHRELRRMLEQRGHVFQTDHSDTEVLIHLHRDWASHLDASRESRSRETDRTVEFSAMFATIVWDRARSVLVVARDAFGEKPLFVTFNAATGLYVMASSAAGVRRVLDLESGVQSQPAPEARKEVQASFRSHLRWGFGGQFTPLPCVWSLPPGSLDALAIGEPPERESLARRTAGAVGAIALLPVSIAAGIAAAGWRAGSAAGRRVKSDEVDAALHRAVGERLEADVPIGCFLSGGIDSSLVAMHAQLHLDGALTTLCVRMPDERYDESSHAQRVADHLGTNHITLDCPSDSAAEDLVKLIEVLGVPFGDSSILPTYWLCKAARAHVKVALAGDGGDEMFFGYERYRAVRWLGLLGLVSWLPWLAFLDRSDPRSKSERLARLIVAARHDRYEDLLAVFPTPDMRRLLRESIAFRFFEERSRINHPQYARIFDLTTYLPGDLLAKVDTASMLAGIEVRCPFLSRAVADVALAPGVGARQLMPRGERKFILKQIARKHLPPEVVDRPKQGFAIPIGEWWRSDFGGLRTLLLDSLSGDQPFGPVHEVLKINMTFVRRMIDEHWAAGGLPPVFTTRAISPRDHSQRLFALVTLAIWAKNRH